MSNAKRFDELTLEERLGNWWPANDGLWYYDEARPYHRHMSNAAIKRMAYFALVELKRAQGVNR